jgi:hypothetical protein
MATALANAMLAKPSFVAGEAFGLFSTANGKDFLHGAMAKEASVIDPVSDCGKRSITMACACGYVYRGRKERFVNSEA